MPGSSTAAENFKDLLEYSALEKKGLAPREGAVSRFYNVYDDNLIVELDGRHRNLDWWVFTCSQMRERNATFRRIVAEPLDSKTFDIQLELCEEGLDRPIYWHSIAWVHPATSKIVKMRFLTGEMALYLFRFNEYNPIYSSDEDETESIHSSDDDQTIRIRNKNELKLSRSLTTIRSLKGQFSSFLTRQSRTSSSKGHRTK